VTHVGDVEHGGAIGWLQGGTPAMDDASLEFEHSGATGWGSGGAWRREDDASWDFEHGGAMR